MRENTNFLGLPDLIIFGNQKTIVYSILAYTNIKRYGTSVTMLHVFIFLVGEYTYVLHTWINRHLIKNNYNTCNCDKVHSGVNLVTLQKRESLTRMMYIIKSNNTHFFRQTLYGSKLRLQNLSFEFELYNFVCSNIPSFIKTGNKNTNAR